MSRSNRQTFVNLSVFASSAALFAAAWTGVVGADRSADELMATTLPVSAAGLRVAVAPVAAQAQAGQMQPAPASAPRQVVIVRQSRAS